MLNKNSFKVIIIIISVVLFVFLCCIFFSLLNINNNKILKGISINGIDVSNLTKAEATKKLSELVNNKINSDINIYYNTDTKDKENTDISYETSLKIATLDAKYDIGLAVNEAYNLGRKGNIFQNNFSILKLLINGKNIDLRNSVDDNNLSKIITNISSNVPDKLVQSSYYIEKDKLIITKGTAGNVMNEGEFKVSLFEILNKIDSTEQNIIVLTEHAEPDIIDIDSVYNEVYREPKDAYYEEDPFKVYKEVEGIDFDKDKAKKNIEQNPDKKEYKFSLKHTEAKIKLEDLDIDIFKDLLGSFSTRYDERNKDRTNNLNLATKKIDGIVISPGEEFSYNKIVGERTIAAGYKESKIYSNGEVVDGLGGGICQISSTLYNAVMFANLNVTERYNHQFVTSYVDPGRDATVVYGIKDFKFINNRTYPIKIKMTVNSGIAKVEIYGIKEDKEYTIDFDVETVSMIDFNTVYQVDNTLNQGQEKIKQAGANGQVVKVYKLTKQNGIELSRDLISQDTYSALNKVILRGTKN